MNTQVIEQQTRNEFTDMLRIIGVTSEHDALHLAEKWCDDNESYCENIAWKEEEQITKDGDFEDVYYVRVCPNDYE